MNKRPLPLKNGVQASYLHLPHNQYFQQHSLLAFLCHQFPFVSEDNWKKRLNSGFVVDADGTPLNEWTPYQAGSTIYYYREISREQEETIPFQEYILHIDEHLIVVDKPHFLPVIPSGRFLHETLLTRLRLRPDLSALKPEHFTPLHRLDKDTAGVILFSHNPQSRAVYQQLFQSRAISKTYHAIAPLRTDLSYPYTIQSRMIRGEQFYLTQEVEGEINAITVIELLQQHQHLGLYQLTPITGKKHQLRVHMNRLNMPLLNDMLYPVVHQVGTENYHKPLQLLAKELRFIDPFTQQTRIFTSQQNLSFNK